jgi:hypothetical protein
VKRRRRGLGSSADTHAKRAGTLEHQAGVLAEDAIRSIEGGDCKRGYRMVASALERRGEANGENHGAGTAPSGEIKRLVDLAEKTFARYCLR